MIKLILKKYKTVLFIWFGIDRNRSTVTDGLAWKKETRLVAVDSRVFGGLISVLYLSFHFDSMDFCALIRSICILVSGKLGTIYS